MAGLSNIGTGRGQNRSTAVMQRRRHSAPDALDYFPTPPFATRALCEFLEGLDYNLEQLTAWEPACGEDHMARPLREFFGSVRASDVHRYHDEHEVLDFTVVGRLEPPVDFVITNPPFRLAEAFVATAMQVSRGGVAMLVRSAFLEGQERYETLFSHNRPDFVLQFVERVAMLEGRLVRAGEVDPFSEEGNKVSSATAYSWLVWLTGSNRIDTRLRWIPPCRFRLERPGDYPEYDVPQLPPPEDGLFSSVAA